MAHRRGASVCLGHPQTVMGRAGALAFVVLYPATYWDFYWPSTEHAANMFVALRWLCLSSNVTTAATGGSRCWWAQPRRWLFTFAKALCSSISCHDSARACPTHLAIPGSYGGSYVGRRSGNLGLARRPLSPFTDLRGYWHITFHYPFLFAQQHVNQTRWQMIQLIMVTPFFAVMGFFFTLAVGGRRPFLAIAATTVGFAASLVSPREHPITGRRCCQ